MAMNSAPRSFGGMDKLDFLDVLRANAVQRQLAAATPHNRASVDLPPPFTHQSFAKIKAFDLKRLKSHDSLLEKSRPSTAASRARIRVRRTALATSKQTFSPAAAYAAATGHQVTTKFSRTRPGTAPALPAQATTTTLPGTIGRNAPAFSMGRRFHTRATSPLRRHRVARDEGPAPISQTDVDGALRKTRRLARTPSFGTFTSNRSSLVAKHSAVTRNIPARSTHVAWAEQAPVSPPVPRRQRHTPRSSSARFGETPRGSQRQGASPGSPPGSVRDPTRRSQHPGAISRTVSATSVSSTRRRSPAHGFGRAARGVDPAAKLRTDAPLRRIPSSFDAATAGAGSPKRFGGERRQQSTFGERHKTHEDIALKLGRPNAPGPGVHEAPTEFKPAKARPMGTFGVKHAHIPSPVGPLKHVNALTGPGSYDPLPAPTLRRSPSFQFSKEKVSPRAALRKSAAAAAADAAATKGPTPQRSTSKRSLSGRRDGSASGAVTARSSMSRG